MRQDSNDNEVSLLSTGASHYGICDIEALIKDTQSSHKFESKYDQTLIAPYDEEHMHVFRERSPIHYMDQMSGALAIFQGDEDKVEQRHEKTCLLHLENKDADQLPGNPAADQRLCFGYIDSTVSLLPKSKNSSLWPCSESVDVQLGLCQTWLETLKTGLVMTQLR